MQRLSKSAWTGFEISISFSFLPFKLQVFKCISKTAFFVRRLFQTLESQMKSKAAPDLAHQIKQFNRNLNLGIPLPAGVSVLNPFKNDERVFEWSDSFYNRFYADNNKRKLILGINPGRLGAGQTGIPFTDTKRLYECLGIGSSDNLIHESSSAFIYRMIESYGGADLFYQRFLISSICPLGFVMEKKGGLINFNYYDSPALQLAVTPFIEKCMETQLLWPICRDEVFCLGTGKNKAFLEGLNEKHGWFKRVVSLEHPRFIMQYKSRFVDAYIEKYIEALTAI